MKLVYVFNEIMLWLRLTDIKSLQFWFAENSDFNWLQFYLFYMMIKRICLNLFESG